jgi:hypothetical protein
MDEKVIATFREHYACQEALNWLNTQPDLKTAWEKCPNGTWMWWTLSHMEGCLPSVSESFSYAKNCMKRFLKRFNTFSPDPLVLYDTYHIILDFYRCAAATGDRYAQKAATTVGVVGALVLSTAQKLGIMEEELLLQAEWIRKFVEVPNLSVLEAKLMEIEQ